MVGRRQATMAPTVAYAGTSAGMSTSHQTSSDRRSAPTTDDLSAAAFQRRKTSEAAARIITSPHTDQASRAAARSTNLPLPRLSSLASAVTTPLYRKIVSRALRHSLRGGRFRGTFAVCSAVREGYCVQLGEQDTSAQPLHQRHLHLRLRPLLEHRRVNEQPGAKV